MNMERELPYPEAAMYYFVYYMNILMMIFERVLNTFQRFSESPKVVEGQQNVFKHFPKISEGCQRFVATTKDFRG